MRYGITRYGRVVHIFEEGEQNALCSTPTHVVITVEPTVASATEVGGHLCQWCRRVAAVRGRR